MGYYASGSGMVVLKNDLKIPAEIIAELGREFSEVADAPDGDLYLTLEFTKYHDDDVGVALQKLAPFVSSGDVEFIGDDNNRWRFHFWNGKVRYQEGRTVYEDASADYRRSDRQELIGQIIDVFEDWLHDKGLTADDIPNDDREDDSDALIYGCDYGTLEGRIEEVLINNELIEEE